MRSFQEDQNLRSNEDRPTNEAAIISGQPFAVKPPADPLYPKSWVAARSALLPSDI